VIVADERIGIRSSLRALFRSRPDVTVVAEAAGPVEALQLARQLRPDVLLLGSGVPASRASELAQALSFDAPSSKVVLLSLDETERQAALAGGVWAFVLSDAPAGELLDAIRSASPTATWEAEPSGRRKARAQAPARLLPVRRAPAEARRAGHYALALLLLGALVLLTRPWSALLDSPAGSNAQLPETVAGPTFIEPLEAYGLDRNRHRVIARTSDPTTASLVDVDRRVTIAVDPVVSQRHALDWQVPEFTEMERTFTLRVELRDLDGRTTVSDPLRVTVMRDSRAAGGIDRPQQLVEFLEQPGNGSARAGFVAILRAVAPSFPGVSQLNADNLAGFIVTNMSRFKVEPLASPLSGRFAYLQADGVVRVGQMTLPAGTPVLTFDGKVLANALCLNELVIR
jgi:DNA-binding NarL/FixJ family response regulator